MSTAHYYHVIFYSFIGGAVSLTGGILLISHRHLAVILAKLATPFAAGALLAAVFLDLLPDGVDEADLGTVLHGALAGVVIFFFMERVFQWFHHHHEHPNEDKKTGKNLPLIIFGNGMHNALDGVAIAASFLVNIQTGIITTIAVAAHEIPHEISDFGLMLARGMSRPKVLLTNVIIALSVVVVATATFAIGNNNGFPTGFLLGLSAGFLLYIAMSDIIPTIHEDMEHRNRLLDWQSLLLVVGVLLVAGAIQLAHRIESGNTNQPAASTSLKCDKVASGESQDLKATADCLNK